MTSTDSRKPRRLCQKFVAHRGAVVVEFAVVLPVIVLMFMGSMEMGRAVMVRHVLEEAARAGCRVAVFENGNKKDVLDIVKAAVAAAQIDDYTVTISPDPPENLNAFQAVTVTVSVPYDDISWLPSGSYMNGKTLTGVCVMPAEGDGANDPESDQTPSGKKNTKNKKDATKKNKKTDTKKNKKICTKKNKKTDTKKNKKTDTKKTGNKKK